MNDFWFPLRHPDRTFNILCFQCSLHSYQGKDNLGSRFLTRTNINSLSEAMRRVMAAKLTRLAQKIAALRRLVAESLTTCRSRCYRRQFGNFLTGLYTLRDAVRIFIHTIKDIFPHSPASSYQSERRFSAKAAQSNKTHV